MWVRISILGARRMWRQLGRSNFDEYSRAKLSGTIFLLCTSVIFACVFGVGANYAIRDAGAGLATFVVGGLFFLFVVAVVASAFHVRKIGRMRRAGITTDGIDTVVKQRISRYIGMSVINASISIVTGAVAVNLLLDSGATDAIIVLAIVSPVGAAAAFFSGRVAFRFFRSAEYLAPRALVRSVMKSKR